MLSKFMERKAPNSGSAQGTPAHHSMSEQGLSGPYFFSKGLESGFFMAEELLNLSLTSKALRGAAQRDMEHLASQKLVTHVVLGEEDKAHVLIQANPKLLLIKSEGKDYSGRTIRATPFQAAIGAGDKPMWEMMQKYMDREEASRQFHEWFPNGIEEAPEKLAIDYDAIALSIIHHADQGQSAIEGFRSDITRQKEITQGVHFDLHHLLAAYQAYNNHFYALGPGWVKRDLFWNQVIGYVQRQMTAYDAQIHCSGVEPVLDNPRLFSRGLKFYKGGDFFPVLPDSGLGFDFGCFCFHGGPRAGAIGFPATEVGAPDLVSICSSELKNYVEQKQKHLQDLESHLSKEHVISQRSCICS
jgi:hypothetical protein